MTGQDIAILSAVTIYVIGFVLMAALTATVGTRPGGVEKGDTGAVAFAGLLWPLILVMFLIVKVPEGLAWLVMKAVDYDFGDEGPSK